MWKDREFWAYNKPYFGLAQIKSLETVLKELDRKDVLNKASAEVIENSILKEKIKEKIEEKEREIQEFIGTDNTGRFTRDNCRITDEVNILKELLKESN